MNSQSLKFASFKIMIILFLGICLGYLTAVRTELPIIMEAVLSEGIFIVLGITLITVLTKDRWMSGVNNALFGASIAIGGAWIPWTGFLLSTGEQRYSDMNYGIFSLVVTMLILFVIGLVLSWYQGLGFISVIISSLPAMYCAFILSSYGKDLLCGAGINFSVLIAAFFLMGKENRKQRGLIVLCSFGVGCLVNGGFV